MYHGLFYVHSHKCTKTNRYLNRQWYDHIDTVKKWATVRCGKPRRVHNVLMKWIKDKRNANVGKQANS
jgi:hypothetical protein